MAGPTTLLTSSWCLFEMLDARRASEEVQLFLQGLGDLKKLWVRTSRWVGPRACGELFREPGFVGKTSVLIPMKFITEGCYCLN